MVTEIKGKENIAKFLRETETEEKSPNQQRVAFLKDCVKHINSEDAPAPATEEEKTKMKIAYDFIKICKLSEVDAVKRDAYARMKLKQVMDFVDANNKQAVEKALYEERERQNKFLQAERDAFNKTIENLVIEKQQAVEKALAKRCYHPNEAIPELLKIQRGDTLCVECYDKGFNDARMPESIEEIREKAVEKAMGKVVAKMDEIDAAVKKHHNDTEIGLTAYIPIRQLINAQWSNAKLSLSKAAEKEGK